MVAQNEPSELRCCFSPPRSLAYSRLAQTIEAVAWLQPNGRMNSSFACQFPAQSRDRPVGAANAIRSSRPPADTRSTAAGSDLTFKPNALLIYLN